MSNNGVGGTKSATPGSAAPNSVRTPPPPGFYAPAVGVNESNSNNGRSLSSPVFPPGFVGGTTAEGLKAATSLAPPQIGITRSGSGGRRSTSYTQLANALGEGLAESMDDSANGGGEDTLHMSGAAESLSRGYETAHSPATLDNFTRQGRHTASRRIGPSNGTMDTMNYRSLNGGLATSSNPGTPAAPTFLSPEQLLGKKSKANGETIIGLESGGNVLEIPALLPPNFSNNGGATSGAVLNYPVQVGLTVVEPYTPSGGASPAVGPEKGGTITPKSYEGAASPGLSAVHPAPQYPQTVQTSVFHLSQDMPSSSSQELHLQQRMAGENGKQQSTDELLGNVTERMLHLGANGGRGNIYGSNTSAEIGGRSSAPPAQSALHCSSSAGASVRASHAASSLQRRAAELQNELNPGQRRWQQQQQYQTHDTVIIGKVGGVDTNLVNSSPSYTPEPGKITQVSNQNGHRHNSAPMPSNALPHSTADRAERARRDEEELAPFLREVMEPAPPGSTSGSRPSARPSRGLTIIRASSLHVPDVRSTCEAFGVLDSFRPEFLESHGVIFLTYHDLRSAQYAAIELPSCLERLATTAGSQSQHKLPNESVMVRYCIPLNSSSANDESMILLSNLPREVDEQSLSTLMMSYGAVRAVHYQADSHGGGRSSYMVEFYDVQDARQAIMELESTQPWGGEVTVTFGANSAEKRKQGRDLLSLLGRWRHNGISTAVSHTNTVGGIITNSPVAQVVQRASPVLSSASKTPPLPSASPVYAGIHSALGTETRSSSHSLASSGTNNSRPIIVSARASASPVISSGSSSPMPLATEATKTKSPVPATSSVPSYGSSTGVENTIQVTKDNPGEANLSTSTSSQQRQTTQLVIGPDGQYSYVMVNTAHHAGNVASTTHSAPATALDPHAAPGSEQVLVNHHQTQQHVVHGPHGTYTTSVHPHLISPAVTHSHLNPHPHVQHHYWHPPPLPNPNSIHHPSANHHQYHHNINTASVGGQASTVIRSPYGDIHSYPTVVPVYATQMGTVHQQPVGDGYSSVSSGSSGPGSQHMSTGKGQRHKSGRGRQSGPKTGGSAACGQHSNSGGSGGGDDGDSDQLTLDIISVKSGRDTRSSLMVRNIPNKYTQSMLLSEFAEGNHGPDKIDFFYLPIDFKNRCNRGYAFVNFVDYRDIVTFHELYNGKNWKNFNSDKICDITYARIQGKEGMLKRFENSALMEKDDEYRPLVFVSHGINKGEREEFPSASRSKSSLESPKC